MEAGSSSAAPTDLQSSLSREQLEELRHEIEMLSHEVAALGMDRKEVCLVHFCGMGVINFVEDKLLKEGQGADASCNQASEGVLCPNVDFRSSVNEDGTNELRYLFVSNGCAICLLDLKQASSDISSTPPLPKIATQNLIEKGLPVSVGLFKLQSEAYMIGGEDFLAYSDETIKRNPSSYAHLCSRSYYHRGRFRSTYRMSAVDNGTICLSECHITKMNAPKIWPIVEEIYGALHVFDCDPSWNSNPTLEWIFSHEVLEREGDRFCWRRIPTSMGLVDSFIRAHLVLGHCIYALAGKKALLFDSRKGRWEERAPDFRSSVNEDGTNELRYLFVSNGCAICLLDLKQASSDISHTPSLPKIATLNLIEKGFPVSAGLFKLQSEVYMIGGEDSPAFVKQAYSDNSIKHNPSSCDLYRHLCSKLYRLKGASCNTYRLSSVDNGTISPSECHIPKLNCPKICPVVEEIYGALHVFDSDVILNEYFIDDSTFSHEVLEREGNRFSWRQISKSGARSGGPANRFIQSHLVIGHHIYVLAKQKALVFDSRKGEWEERAPIYPFKACSYEMGTVWDIMMYAKARCVLQVGPGEAEDDKELYVVVALVNVYGGEDEWRTTTEAVAYLVNSVGDVVLKQVLEEFFEGPMKPTITATARVIKADEEGKTMCSIVKAGGLVNDSEYSSHEYLFVNTFTVKELLSCAITASRRNLFSHFVRVEVKNRYIFKIDEEDDEFHDFVDLQACFI